MSWVCVGVGVLFLICVLVGWAQGMFKVLISVAGLIASVIVSVYIAPSVSGFLEQNTQLDEKIATYITEEMQFSEDGIDASKGEQVEVINALPLPDTLKSNILDNNNSEMYSALEAVGIYDYIAKSMAVVILNATVFFILVVVGRVFFGALGKMVVGLKKLPIVRSIDKIGGGLLGGMYGLILIWIFFLFLSVTSTWEISREMIVAVNQFSLFNLLYDNNVLLDIVGDLTRILFL